MARSTKKKTIITKRWLINYLLFFVVICLTWVAIKFPVEEFDKAKNAITNLKAEDVTLVKLETADNVIQIQKTDNNWFIERPLQWSANNIAVERLLGITRLQTESRLPESQIDLSTLGLKIPRAVMSLNKTDFLFGDSNNIGNRRYLQVDSMVYLIEDRHLPFINQGLTGLLDRRLLPPAIKLVKLKLPDISLTWDNPSWIAEDNPNISSDDLNRLIEKWQGQQATKIQFYTPKKTPLKKIIAFTEDKKSIEFFVLTIKPEIIIARADLGFQYHFPASLYYELFSAEQN